MPPDAAFSRTKCAGPTCAPTGTICILFVSLTTRMNLSTQSAQPWRSLNFVGITTAYSWGWGRNIHCWVVWHHLKKVDNAFPAGRRSWNWRIWFSGVQLRYSTWKRRNSSLESVIEVILFTLRILDPDVMRFRHDPLVGIGIIYLAIKSQTLNRSRVVKWLTVIQQPILEFIEYTVKEYILIVSEHESTNFVSPVLFNFCAE